MTTSCPSAWAASTRHAQTSVPSSSTEHEPHSNITVSAGAQGEVAADVRTPGRRTAATTRSPASGSTSSSSRPTRPGRCTSATRGGPRSATRWPGCSTRPAPRVEREFYINDRGSQMDKFGASVEAPRAGEPVPEDGYQGAYVDDVAQQVLAEEPGILDLPDDERAVAFREAGYRIQLAEQQAARHLPHPLRRLVLRAVAARLTAPWPTAWRSCAARATCSTPTARCGCAPPTSATTRTGC